MSIPKCVSKKKKKKLPWTVYGYHTKEKTCGPISLGNNIKQISLSQNLMGGIVRKGKKDQLGNGGEVEEQSSIPPVADKCHRSLFMPEKIQSTI